MLNGQIKDFLNILGKKRNKWIDRMTDILEH